MLKRLSSSFTKEAQQPNDLALLIPPTPGFRTPGFASPRSSPKRASFPYDSFSSYPFPTASAPPATQSTGVQHDRTAAPARTIERAVLHKTLTNLSSLLVALDELRDTSQAHSKARKHVAKATRDLADGFREKTAGAGGRSDEVAEALMGCASMLEGLQEVEEKHAKALRKEYEGLNEAIARYFRKTAKEEKAHEDRLAELDARVAKATAAYQSTARSTSASSQRNMHAALDSMTAQHSSYMHELSALSAQINQVKAAYSSEVASRRELSTREVASALCAMTEREWRKDVEAVRRGAESVGRLVTAAVWVAPGMERVAIAAPSDPGTNAGRAFGAAETVEPIQRRFEEPPTALAASRAPSSGTIETSNSSSMVSPSPFRESTFSRASDSSSVVTSSGKSEARPAPTSPFQHSSPPRLGELEHQQDGSFLRIASGRGSTEEPRAFSPPNRTPLEDSRTPRSISSNGPIRLGTTIPTRQDESALANEAADQLLDRQDSFVARMSRKYSAVDPRSPSHALEDPVSSRHVRSDSRVSQLAKRYSAPPQSVDSRSPPTPVSIPAQREQHLPPWNHSANSVVGDRLSTSSQSIAGQIPPRGAEPAYTLSSPRISTPGSARLRAYQMATPLPRESR